MVRQLTFSLLLMAVIACADDYILATGEDGTEIVYAADRMVYTNWLSDCVLWMPFPSDVGGGSYPDYSKEQNDGSQSTVTNRPTWTDGAYVFDGIQDYIEISDDSSLDITSELTMTAWFKSEVTGATACGIIFDRRSDTGGEGYFCNINYDSDGIYFLINDGVNQIIDNRGSVGYNDTSWHSLGCTISLSSDVATIYIDGLQIGTNIDISSITGTVTPSKPLMIGFYGRSPFNGAIDDARIYNIALTSNQVNQIYLDTKGAH